MKKNGKNKDRCLKNKVKKYGSPIKKDANWNTPFIKSIMVENKEHSPTKRETSVEIKFTFSNTNLSEKEKETEIKNTLLDIEEKSIKNLKNIFSADRAKMEGYIREYVIISNLFSEIKSRNKNFTAKQHFVPNTYSQWFADKNILSFISKNEIGVDSSNTLVVVSNSTIPKSGLYSQGLENLFSQLEGDYSKIISTFLNKTDTKENVIEQEIDTQALISNFDSLYFKTRLSIFVATQIMRTTYMLKRVAETIPPEKQEYWLVDSMVSQATNLAMGKWQWFYVQDDLAFASDPVALLEDEEGKFIAIPIGRHLLLKIRFGEKALKTKKSKYCSSESEPLLIEYWKNVLEKYESREHTLYGHPFDSPFKRIAKSVLSNNISKEDEEKITTPAYLWSKNYRSPYKIKHKIL